MVEYLIRTPSGPSPRRGDVPTTPVALPGSCPLGRNQEDRRRLALVLGTLSVSFLCRAPGSRWLVNRNILCAVYSLSHNIAASVANFSSTKMCQGQKSFNWSLKETTALRTTTGKFQNVLLAADVTSQCFFFFTFNFFFPFSCSGHHRLMPFSRIERKQRSNEIKRS